MARAMVPYLERHLPGARFVVLNRPGAGAEIGYTALATAPPDGLTIGVVIVPSLQTITIERTPRYRLQDLAFLGSVVDDPGGFFVAPDSPLRSLAELADHARANPDKVAVGTAGIGSDDHLLMLGFERLDRHPSRACPLRRPGADHHRAARAPHHGGGDEHRGEPGAR